MSSIKNETDYFKNNDYQLDNYSYINMCENQDKIWTNNFRGSIIESTFKPKQERIIQYAMPFNQPQHYKNYFDTISKKNRNNTGSCKNVNKHLYLTTHI